MGDRPKVLVVDFGGQYTHLIARRCRELGVYSEIVEPGSLEEALGSGSVRGLILSGGPRSVLEQGSPRVSERILRSPPVPMLGICYGHQLIAHMLGGRVVSGLAREYGRVKVRVVERDKLLKDIPSELEVWMSHGDSVAEPPKNMKATSLSENGVITSMRDGEKIYTTQFHPEVSHTQHGKTILRNFLQEICRIPPTWKPRNMIDEMVENVRRTVGGERVICAVSGGVDSMTTAYILSKAVGGNLYCIFVDTGLLRKGEGERVEERVSFGGVTVAVTSRGLIVAGGGTVASVNPVHVVSVGFGYALGELAAGALLILVSLTLASLDPGDVGYAVASALYLAGLALAAYGWLHRYKLAIVYVGGRVELRGGGGVPRAARRLRQVILDILEARAAGGQPQRPGRGG